MHDILNVADADAVRCLVAVMLLAVHQADAVAVEVLRHRAEVRIQLRSDDQQHIRRCDQLNRARHQLTVQHLARKRNARVNHRPAVVADRDRLVRKNIFRIKFLSAVRAEIPVDVAVQVNDVVASGPPGKVEKSSRHDASQLAVILHLLQRVVYLIRLAALHQDLLPVKAVERLRTVVIERAVHDLTGRPTETLLNIIDEVFSVKIAPLFRRRSPAEKTDNIRALTQDLFQIPCTHHLTP